MVGGERESSDWIEVVWTRKIRGGGGGGLRKVEGDFSVRGFRKEREREFRTEIEKPGYRFFRCVCV